MELRTAELRSAESRISNTKTQRHKSGPSLEFSPPRHKDTSLVPGPQTVVHLRAVVSSGTYVRSLARDIGEKLGCGATLQSLVRTRVGEFSIENAVGIEDSDLVSRLIPVNTALAFLPGATVVADALPRLLSGRTLAQDEVRMTNDDCATTALDSPIVVQDEAQRVLFIAQYSDGKLKPKRGIYADV